jgi:flavin reductase (DIM6/NTAB) family NADH-FMN oxidoreductase RutF
MKMQKQTPIPQALERKYPEPVVLITTADGRGRTNIMSVGWYSIVSSEPWMFLVAIDSGAFTYDLIRKTREFNVAFPDETMAGAVLLAGTVHGHQRDKLQETGLRTQPAIQIKPPLIMDAVANFECRLVKILKPGDCPLLIGEIVAAHVRRKAGAHRLYTIAPNYRLEGVRPHRPGKVARG